MTTPLEILRDVYGYDRFRGQQSAAINAVLSGNDALVLMPTGGGKSICYQIPALIRHGVGIVVSPLIALMQDQVTALSNLGIAAAFLNSSQSRFEQQTVIESIEDHTLDILYLAPERLLQRETLEYLRNLEVSVIAIDEAHCVSAWGHDFRQDYLALNELAEAFPGVPRIALTATADARTRDDIVARLALDTPIRIIEGFDRPNIRYSVAVKENARSQLRAFLRDRRNEAGIVYCLSRKSVDATAQWLCSEGYDAVPYHAGLDRDTRANNQSRFLREDGVIVVATIAFGMGIDKPDVRFVAHVDLPKNLEAYYQETGRAGRDGEPAEAWMVYGLQDVVRLSQMTDTSQATDTQKRVEREKLQALLGWCEVTTCRRRALLAYFGEEYGEQPCGNCDVCLEPPKTWDATVDAQKLLSCIYRTGQRFGAAYVIDVLRGSENDRVESNGHRKLSTFGIGADRNVASWRSMIRQLIVQGYLFADPERYGALRLTAQSRELLRGAVVLELREDARVAKASTKKKRSAASLDVRDPSLFDALRELRRQIADADGVPPYVVFHDATLREMANAQPSNSHEFLELSGVGNAKLERYGEAFLAALSAHRPASGVAQTDPEEAATPPQYVMHDDTVAAPGPASDSWEPSLEFDDVPPDWDSR